MRPCKPVQYCTIFVPPITVLRAVSRVNSPTSAVIQPFVREDAVKTAPLISFCVIRTVRWMWTCPENPISARRCSFLSYWSGVCRELVLDPMDGVVEMASYFFVNFGKFMISNQVKMAGEIVLTHIFQMELFLFR